ncbi:aromatic prenyltransferase (DMATS family) [Aspergillus tubingensis]|uniref:Reverse prenyltransferase n=2 Tax=Aspergillus subgen. Circumdati TaxID=2720871 RepID=A0A100IEG1_ASPNG|nr:reverse prenyltransferase [Aspergillus tubingensis]GAQ39709.1 reverse prenyltransferase [Aspergillus niger]GFN18090.1 reverse prenyltransferase [Aspergillus tubingensis]GLA73265.1 aromatic prenyltransferase (DMATS family) [Aspergillus tubingensis]GLA83747.1 aromatic prenyltransferase (DMATS family) [Aspergillus tubingensis]GLA90685.1 aromatic prenyltransferase (DMATS family) [Aspergillus tubingensis]
MASPFLGDEASSHPKGMEASPPAASPEHQKASSGINVQSTHRPWDIIVKYITSTNAAESSWWRNIGPLLGRLLQITGYSVPMQFEYLLFARNHIVPALGPYPQRWPSVMTYTDLPIEMSVNFQDHHASTVRVGIEPICELAGTSNDRFNQTATERLVGRLSTLGGLDRMLYHHFVRDFGITEMETLKVKQGEFKRDSVQSMYNIGFTFERVGAASVDTKGYVFLRLKEKASGMPMQRLLRDSLNQLNVTAERRDSEAVQKVIEYMEEGGGFNEYTYLAWDFVDSAKSRIKVYGVLGDLRMEKVKEVWTMGGRLKDSATTQGLELVRRLWELLEGNGQQGQHPSKAPILMWNYEIRPCRDEPIPKLYLPLLGRNDMFVAKTLARFFDSLGWADEARSYVANVQYLFPDEDLELSARLHSWVSLAYTSQAGVYVSVYYHSSLA